MGRPRRCKKSQNTASTSRTINADHVRVTLPLDVIGIIAKCLIDNYVYGTCAALNVTAKAVEEETTPILWKTFVLWGAKTFQSFPDSVWSRDALASAVLRHRIGVCDAKMQRDWDKIISFKRAQWIQYVAVPSLADDNHIFGGPAFASSIHAGGLPRPPPVGSLSRLKAAILLSTRTGCPRDELGITVMTTPEYRYGSDNLLHLSRAVEDFQRVGGPRISKACNDDAGIMLISQGDGSPDTSSISHSAFLRPVAYALPYVPRVIKVSQSYESDTRHAAAFMEGLEWLRTGVASKNERREIQLVKGNLEFCRRCARLVQKAVKADPNIARFLIRFFLPADGSLTNPVAANKDARGIIDIVRGTYLYAQPHVSLDKLGKFLLGIEVPWHENFAAWEVRPSISKNAILSRFVLGQEIGLLAMDPWGKA